MAFYFHKHERTLKLNIEFMNAKAALCKHLLMGHVLNIKNCFQLIGLTNCPREISRMIEQPFKVIVTRIPREGKSRYGQAVTWFDYHLNKKLSENKDGVQEMIRYVIQNTNPKTDKQIKELKKFTSASPSTNVKQTSVATKYQTLTLF
jgi:hypothetical protein